jgi:hypothetical protein
MKRLISYITLFSMALPAAAAPESSASGPDWEVVDKRSEVVYKASTYGVLGGIVLSLAGGFSDQHKMQLSGDLITHSATVGMIGAALRQRKSIVNRGVKTTGAWGYSAWALQASSLGLAVSAYAYEDNLDYDTSHGLDEEDVGPLLKLGLGSLACGIGALLTASKQHNENAYRRSLIGRSEAAAESSGMTVAMLPLVGADGSLGVGAMATF